jgi:hypothetical protein
VVLGRSLFLGAAHFLHVSEATAAPSWIVSQLRKSSSRFAHKHANNVPHPSENHAPSNPPVVRAQGSGQNDGPRRPPVPKRSSAQMIVYAVWRKKRAQGVRVSGSTSQNPVPLQNDHPVHEPPCKGTGFRIRRLSALAPCAQTIFRADDRLFGLAGSEDAGHRSNASTLCPYPDGFPQASRLLHRRSRWSKKVLN